MSDSSNPQDATPDSIPEPVQQFVEDVLKTGRVWGLREKNGDGWAVCDSIVFEDTEVFPLWSSETEARRHCNEEWDIYRPGAISLEEFLEDWLPGIHEDDALVGPNWDIELSGEEIEPADLASLLADTGDVAH